MALSPAAHNHAGALAIETDERVTTIETPWAGAVWGTVIMTFLLIAQSVVETG